MLWINILILFDWNLDNQWENIEIILPGNVSPLLDLRTTCTQVQIYWLCDNYRIRLHVNYVCIHV